MVISKPIDDGNEMKDEFLKPKEETCRRDIIGYLKKTRNFAGTIFDPGEADSSRLRAIVPN